MRKITNLTKKIKRITTRCETKPQYLGLDLILQLGNQAKLKLKRRKQLETNIPDIWSYKSVLYIGARTDRIDFGKNFQKKNYEIDILEIHKPNVNYLKSISWINKVIHEDVIKINKSIKKKL